MPLKSNRCYLLFEEVSLLQRECICLGDDWDDVDHFTQTSHEFDIKRPKTEETQHERTGRKTVDLRTKAQEIVTQSSRTRGQMFLRNVPGGGTFTVPTSYHAPIITQSV